MALLNFFGATRQVTGSCYLLEANGEQVLLECGMNQGFRKDQERREMAWLGKAISRASNTSDQRSMIGKSPGRRTQCTFAVTCGTASRSIPQRDILSLPRLHCAAIAATGYPRAHR